MAINESNDGQDLAVEIKKEFEKKIKEVIEELKEGETTISQEGIQLASTKGQYIMSVRGIPVAIIAKTGKDSYEFNYNLNNIQELEEVLKQNEEEFKLLPQLKQIAELGKQEKQKEQERADDARDTLENDEANDESKEEKEEPDKDKEEPEQEEGRTRDVKMDSTAMEIRGDKKIDKNNTFGKKIQSLYPGLIEGDEKFFVKPDENDRYNFRLYAMKKDGTVVELPTDTRSEGKNAREEQVLVYNKDGTKLEQKQPLQIMMINKDFGITVFGEGDRYREVTTLSRSGGDEYNGHVLCRNGATNEMHDASYDVRQATDDTLGERNQGDAEYKIYVRLKELEEQNVPDELNPAKDSEEISSADIETPGGEENVLAVMEEGLVKKYGISSECAEYVSRQVILEGKNFEDALKEGVLQEEQKKEESGQIMPGSAEASADARIEELLNNEENESQVDDDLIPGRRRV